MAETIINGCMWLWTDMMRDLDEQAGFEIIIDPLSFKNNSCMGVIKNTREWFTIIWQPHSMLLSTAEDQPELVAAFSEVLEYKPFCRYSKQGMLTYVWLRIKQDEEFEDLSQDESITNLERLETDVEVSA